MILDLAEQQQNIVQKENYFRSDGKKNTRNTRLNYPIRSAPEVLRQESATIKSDVYSFGVVMWEVIIFFEFSVNFL